MWPCGEQQVARPKGRASRTVARAGSWPGAAVASPCWVANKDGWRGELDLFASCTELTPWGLQTLQCGCSWEGGQLGAVSVHAVGALCTCRGR